jgi:hypothetical protein
MVRWECQTELLWADAETPEARELIRQRWPDFKPGKYAPEALMVTLNKRGADGWELVSIQPVLVGRNSDLKVHEGTGTDWSNVYLCAFKRPIE